MCCCIPSEPIEDQKGKRKTFPDAPNFFQVDMMNSWYVDCPYSCFWFIGQFLPISCGVTQYMLRHKFLQGDMTKYICFQGIWDPICCCIHPGSMGEKDCPGLCLFCESCLCNGLAVSATRIATMQKYDLRSDPCDYRLIWISNCLQCLSCVCDILAIIDGSFKQLANILDIIAELFYHTVSGCMTAQVAHELNFQQNPNKQALVNNEFQQGTGNIPNESYNNKNAESDPTYYPPTEASPANVVVVVDVHQQQQQQQHTTVNV